VAAVTTTTASAVVLSTTSMPASARPSFVAPEAVEPEPDRLRSQTMPSNALQRGASGRAFAAPANGNCDVCGKGVYAMEKLEADGRTFHKTCFRCTVCNKAMALGNFAALEGKVRRRLRVGLRDH
jgi:hypothetical protein